MEASPSRPNLAATLLSLLEKSLELRLDSRHLLALLMLLVLLGILNLLDLFAPDAQKTSARPEDLVSGLLKARGRPGKGDFLALLAQNPALLSMALNILAGKGEKKDKGELSAEGAGAATRP